MWLSDFAKSDEEFLSQKQQYADVYSNAASNPYGLLENLKKTFKSSWIRGLTMNTYMAGLHAYGRLFSTPETSKYIDNVYKRSQKLLAYEDEFNRHYSKGALAGIGRFLGANASILVDPVVGTSFALGAELMSPITSWLGLEGAATSASLAKGVGATGAKYGIEALGGGVIASGIEAADKGITNQEFTTADFLDNEFNYFLGGALLGGLFGGRTSLVGRAFTHYQSHNLNKTLAKEVSEVVKELKDVPQDVNYLDSRSIREMADHGSMQLAFNNYFDVDGVVKKNANRILRKNKTLYDVDKVIENSKHNIDILNKTIKQINEDLAKAKTKPTSGTNTFDLYTTVKLVNFLETLDKNVLTDLEKDFLKNVKKNSVLNNYIDADLEHDKETISRLKKITPEEEIKMLEDLNNNYKFSREEGKISSSAIENDIKMNEERINDLKNIKDKEISKTDLVNIYNKRLKKELLSDYLKYNKDVGNYFQINNLDTKGTLKINPEIYSSFSPAAEEQLKNTGLTQDEELSIINKSEFMTKIDPATEETFKKIEEAFSSGSIDETLKNSLFSDFEDLKLLGDGETVKKVLDEFIECLS